MFVGPANASEYAADAVETGGPSVMNSLNFHSVLPSIPDFFSLFANANLRLNPYG